LLVLGCRSGLNIEINKHIEDDFLKLQSIFRGKSIDKIKFRIPVLLTYDSKVIENNEDINEKFNIELEKEIIDLYSKIEKNEIKTDLKNIEFIFMLFPFDAVSKIKSDLESVELAMKI
jgi:Cap4 SAVED domain